MFSPELASYLALFARCDADGPYKLRVDAENGLRTMYSSCVFAR